MSRVQALEGVNIFCFVTDNLHDFSLTVKKKKQKKRRPSHRPISFLLYFPFSLVFLFFLYSKKNYNIHLLFSSNIIIFI